MDFHKLPKTFLGKICTVISVCQVSIITPKQVDFKYPYGFLINRPTNISVAVIIVRTSYLDSLLFGSLHIARLSLARKWEIGKKLELEYVKRGEYLEEL
jgi:hypothetical protein